MTRGVLWLSALRAICRGFPLNSDFEADPINYQISNIFIGGAGPTDNRGQRRPNNATEQYPRRDRPAASNTQREYRPTAVSTETLKISRRDL